ncbi:hypothetical protein GPECTOR_14g74 [Gonium pectorale]|uniref:Uncharacterized protein n=1 Tax=Gonium pectorale TaxID=33097 RepID=A0A150GMS4_GONPE|nr:hypothetical protein GPECTOR_14g74 [Gonium pectorale]|eukprot:KXZ51091.1 hypothetical protein GPECTOR_14g74 [Gonium pectorale]
MSVVERGSKPEEDDSNGSRGGCTSSSDSGSDSSSDSGSSDDDDDEASAAQEPIRNNPFRPNCCSCPCHVWKKFWPDPGDPDKVLTSDGEWDDDLAAPGPVAAPPAGRHTNGGAAAVPAKGRKRGHSAEPPPARRQRVVAAEPPPPCAGPGAGRRGRNGSSGGGASGDGASGQAQPPVPAPRDASQRGAAEAKARPPPRLAGAGTTTPVAAAVAARVQTAGAAGAEGFQGSGGGGDGDGGAAVPTVAATRAAPSSRLSRGRPTLDELLAGMGATPVRTVQDGEGDAAQAQPSQQQPSQQQQQQRVGAVVQLEAGQLHRDGLRGVPPSITLKVIRDCEVQPGDNQCKLQLAPGGQRVSVQVPQHLQGLPLGGEQQQQRCAHSQLASSGGATGQRHFDATASAALHVPPRDPLHHPHPHLRPHPQSAPLCPPLPRQPPFILTRGDTEIPGNVLQDFFSMLPSDAQMPNRMYVELDRSLMTHCSYPIVIKDWEGRRLTDAALRELLSGVEEPRTLALRLEGVPESCWGMQLAEYGMVKEEGVLVLRVRTLMHDRRQEADCGLAPPQEAEMEAIMEEEMEEEEEEEERMRERGQQPMLPLPQRALYNVPSEPHEELFSQQHQQQEQQQELLSQQQQSIRQQEQQLWEQRPQPQPCRPEPHQVGGVADGERDAHAACGPHDLGERLYPQEQEQVDLPPLHHSAGDAVQGTAPPPPVGAAGPAGPVWEQLPPMLLCKQSNLTCRPAWDVRPLELPDMLPEVGTRIQDDLELDPRIQRQRMRGRMGMRRLFVERDGYVDSVTAAMCVEVREEGRTAGEMEGRSVLLDWLPAHGNKCYFIGWGLMPGGSLVLRVTSRSPAADSLASFPEYAAALAAARDAAQAFAAAEDLRRERLGRPTPATVEAAERADDGGGAGAGSQRGKRQRRWRLLTDLIETAPEIPKRVMPSRKPAGGRRRD